MTLLITGAAGFIGSHLVARALDEWPDRRVVSLDRLTYSGHSINLQEVADHPRHTFVRADITDRDTVRDVFREFDVRRVMHLAAESHVDRSIVDAGEFVRTNVMGTVVLLEEATRAWSERREGVPFHHVSTDEVYGTLGTEGRFSESTPYSPRSPYAASKASSDHFVRAWHETHGLPTLITNCTNNYGPRQFPEKLIPVTITRAVHREPIPIYGKGENVRDWLYVGDHVDALVRVHDSGETGATYCIGGESEVSNLQLVEMIADELDRQLGEPAGTHRSLITFVPDRPGHDFRYAMDIARIRSELGWKPEVSLRDGIALTVRWYLDNESWLETIDGDEHRDFSAAWYGRTE